MPQNSTYSKVKTIAEDTGLNEIEVAYVLYDYLTWCLQEVLIDGESKTLFGVLKLNDNDILELQHDKEGLIKLLDKSSRITLLKICEKGPEARIFD